MRLLRFDWVISDELVRAEVYAKISYNLGGFGKKGEKTDQSQPVQKAIISDLIYHLTQERLSGDGRPQPQLEIKKTGTEHYLKLTDAGLQYCLEECWLSPDSLNIIQPPNTKWKPRPIPSA